MSNWIVVAITDLYNSKAATLVDAANSAALGAGQADRVTGILADVTSEIRRKVARCNQLDANLSAIPAGLKSCAVDIIYCRLKIALEMDLSLAERDALQARERELNRVADGRDLVDPPDNPLPANFTTALPQPAFGPDRNRWRRWENQIDG